MHRKVLCAHALPRSQKLQARWLELEKLAQSAQDASTLLPEAGENVIIRGKKRTNCRNADGMRSNLAREQPTPETLRYETVTKSKDLWREGSHVSTLLGNSGRLEYIGKLSSRIINALRQHMVTLLSQRIEDCKKSLDLESSNDEANHALYAELRNLQEFIKLSFSSKDNYAVISLLDEPDKLCSSDQFTTTPLFVAAFAPQSLCQVNTENQKHITKSGDVIQRESRLEGAICAKLNIMRALGGKFHQFGKSFAEWSNSDSSCVVYPISVRSHPSGASYQHDQDFHIKESKVGLGVGVEFAFSTGGKDVLKHSKDPAEVARMRVRSEKMRKKHTQNLSLPDIARGDGVSRNSTRVFHHDDENLNLVENTSFNSMQHLKSNSNRSHFSVSTLDLQDKFAPTSHEILRECEIRTFYEVLSGLEEILPSVPSTSAVSRSALAAVGLGASASSIDLGGGCAHLGQNSKSGVGKRPCLIIPTKWLRKPRKDLITKNEPPKDYADQLLSLINEKSEMELKDIKDNTDSEQKAKALTTTALLANTLNDIPDDDSNHMPLKYALTEDGIDVLAIDVLMHDSHTSTGGVGSLSLHKERKEQWRLPVPVRSAAARSALMDYTLSDDTVTVPSQYIVRNSASPGKALEGTKYAEVANRIEDANSNSPKLSQHMSSAASRQRMLGSLRRTVREREKKGLLPAKADLEALENRSVGDTGAGFSVSASLLPLTSQAWSTTGRLYDDATSRLPGGLVENARAAWRVKRHLEAKYGSNGALKRYGVEKELGEDELAIEATVGYEAVVSGSHIFGRVAPLDQTSSLSTENMKRIHKHFVSPLDSMTESSLENGFVALANAGGDKVLETKRLVQLKLLGEKMNSMNEKN